MSRKPLLVFEGNCQSQHLAAILESTGEVQAVHVGRDYGFVPAFEGNPCKTRPLTALGSIMRDAQTRGQPVIRCYQTSPLAPVPTDLAEGADHVALFPEVRFYVLDPPGFRGTFNAPHVSIKRIFDFDIKNIRYSQKKANFSVDISSYIATNAPKRILFHTVNHPNGEILSLLASGLLDQLASYVDRARFSGALERLSKAEGLNSLTDHPVDPTMLSELEFDWGPDYAHYGQMIQLGTTKNWSMLGENLEEYGRRFGHDTMYWEYRARYYKNVKNFAESLAACEELLRRSPGTPKYWKIAADQIVASHANQPNSDPKPELVALMHRSAKFFGASNTANMIAGFTLEAMRNYNAAETKYKTYYELAKLSPEEGREIEALKPLLNLLVRRKRYSAALDIIETERENSSYARTVLERYVKDKKLDAMMDARDPDNLGLLPIPLPLPETPRGGRTRL